MGIMLKQLLGAIPAEYILNNNANPYHSFEGLYLVGENMPVIDVPFIYIGSRSYFPDFINNLTACCLIIRDDTGEDYSGLKCSNIVLDMSIKIMDIYQKMSITWTTLENRMCIAFYNKLIRTGNLESILNEIAKELSCGVLILDSRLDGKLIAYSGCIPADDQSFSQFIKTGHSTKSHTIAARQEGVVKEISQSTIPIMVGPGKYKTRKRILGNITIYNKLVGYIIVIEDKKPFASFDLKRISTACEAIAYIAETDADYIQDLTLTSVFIRSHLQTLLIGLNPAAILINKWPFLKSEVSFWIFVLDTNSNSVSGHMIFDSLQKQCYKYSAQIFEHAQHYIILFGAPEQESYQTFLLQLTELLKEHECYGAVSEVFSDYTELSKYYQHALSTLQLGKQLNSKKWIMTYPEMKLNLFLSEIPIDILIEKYYDESLYKLLQYDRKKGTTYYETLYMYFKCACSRSATASKLYLHRNTVSYQLNKIEEILNLKLDDGERCFQLFLSFKIDELRNKY